jgi:hypothetical protein
VLEDIVSCVNSDSHFLNKLREISNQSRDYFKVILFSVLLVMTTLNIMIFIATIDNTVRGYSLAFYGGSLLAILFDSQWVEQINRFSQLYNRFSRSGFTTATTVIYIIAVFLKQLVFGYFFSEIIRSN